MAEADRTRPRLREVEVLQGPAGMILLRDPSDPALPAVQVDARLGPLLGLFDGTNDLRDLQAAYMRRHGVLIYTEDLNTLIAGLRRGLMLDGPEYQEYQQSLVENFRRAPCRQFVHAGACYAGAPEELRAQLDGYLAEAERTLQPLGTLPAARAIVAPHLDPTACGRAYAAAYRWLQRTGGASLYVILGTGHRGLEEKFAATEKDFNTPLGLVKTDVEAVRELAASSGVDLFRGELLHRTEHTIEFQAVWLAHAFPDLESYRILPVLCGFRHQEFALLGGEPPQVSGLVRALRSLVERRGGSVCLIASVDLAHLGPRYGDHAGLTEGRLADLDQQDRAMLDEIVRGSAAGFLERILAEDNARRVCGFGPLYTMLRVIEGCRGTLLDYGAAPVDQAGSYVSYCAMGLSGLD